MTNALLFFNHNDFFGETKNGEEIDIVSIMKTNAGILYQEFYKKKCIPPGAPDPGSPELPWENENDELWKKLKEIKTLMKDCLVVNHYITPEITAQFYEQLKSVIKKLQDKYFYIKANPVYVWGNLLQTKYADQLGNLFFWLAAAKRLKIKVYLMSKEEFERDYEEKPASIQELIKKIDIHVAFELEKKYDFEFASKIIEEGKVIIGHDDGGHTKAEFSFIPFMLNKWQFYCKKLPKVYLEAIQDFVEKYDGKMAQLIPPFASIPCKLDINIERVYGFMDFFRKIGCQKVIVKGSHTAANRGSDLYDITRQKDVFCPYIFLDLAAEPETWLIELNNYKTRYGYAQNSSIMLQSVVRDPKAKQIEERYEEAIVHKTTVIGDVVWRQCVKTIYYFLQDFWKTHDMRIMAPKDIPLHYLLKNIQKKPEEKIREIAVLERPEKGRPIMKEVFQTVVRMAKSVIGQNRDFKLSELEKEFSGVNQQLDMAGEYINLISPLGAHALDIVFGKIEEQGEREMYLLEANGSYTRSDPLPLHEFTRTYTKDTKTMFQEYLEWALAICNKNPEQAGAYTKKLFFELEEKERSEYLKGVEMLARIAYIYLTNHVIYCSNGVAVFPEFKKVAV